MTSSLFKLGLLLSLFLHSQGGVTEDSTGSLSSCRVRTEDELLKPTTTGAATNQTLQEVCTESSFDDDDDEDVISESSYQVGSPASHVPDELGSDMGEAQSIDMNQAPAILDRITKARSYMEHQVAVDKKYDKVRSLCKNQHPSCAFWAVIGECESNPGYMQVGCAPVCQTCEMLHVETRCPLDPDAVDALYPGDLDELFENIATSSDFEHFGPKVLSRPSYSPGDNADTADYQLGPWMVTFDNAITDQQADRLIELGGIEGYERSADVGSKKEDGTYTAETNSGRTSTNAWCTNECNEDPVAIEVMDRIATITGIPEENSEYLQLLQYREGQFYQTHNDYIPYQRSRPSGVRILTFYIYLNDLEEGDGGGTNFPELGLTVTPKKGRAVLWPSVLNSNPSLKDKRSDHQALPVLNGKTKYGANAWVHLRDYKGPNRMGCV